MIMKKWIIVAKDGIKEIAGIYHNCTFEEAYFLFEQEHPKLVANIFSIEGKN